MKVPLRLIFGASNETPEDETLNALYDRFLVRILVNFVEQDESFSSIVFGKAGSIPINTKLSIKELDSLSKFATKVKVPPDVQEMILVLKRKLAEIGVVLSDRRWKHLVGFLKTLAAASNRNRVRETDLLILQDMLWDEPTQIKAINGVVWEIVVADEHAAEELLKDVKGTKDAFVKNHMRKEEDRYSYDKPKKVRVPVDKINLKMIMKQIQEIEKDLTSARKKVSDRRKKYEKQLVNNQWIEPIGLIEDIEKEMSELVKVDDSLAKFQQTIQDWPKEEDDKEVEVKRRRRDVRP
jgi:MoxR-like ATPase